MVISSYQKEKIRKQIDLIEEEIRLMRQDINTLIGAVAEEIHNYSRTINVPKRTISIDYSRIPAPIEIAIKSSELDQKISLFWNIQFKGSPRLSRLCMDVIAAIYRALNHCVVIICQVHEGISLGDHYESLLKNIEKLDGGIAELIKKNAGWVKEFKDDRFVSEHRSPVEYFLIFQVRPEGTTAHLSLQNPHNKAECELFNLIGYLNKLEDFFGILRAHISDLIN